MGLGNAARRCLRGSYGAEDCPIRYPVQAVRGDVFECGIGTGRFVAWGGARDEWVDFFNKAYDRLEGNELT
jgi:hypothetical protein